MPEKTIISVSEIVTAELPNMVYSYGFTVQYENGEIRNIMLLSPHANDAEIIRKLNEQRKIFQNELQQRKHKMKRLRNGIISPLNAKILLILILFAITVSGFGTQTAIAPA